MREDRVIVRLVTEEELERLRPLWEALYAHQLLHGMRIVLPQDAFDAWTTGMRPSLGRFGFVVASELDGEFLGFLAGRIRMLPPHFGSQPVGFIGEVFVSEDQRSRGLGARMLVLAMEWFRENGVKRVELQVVIENRGAVRFYERLGWHKELVQLVFDASQS
jgi:RimJ/RimL family protein N-acetyltransferase